jgi:hypothetical protein
VHGLVVVQDDDAGFFCTITLFPYVVEVCVDLVSWYLLKATHTQRGQQVDSVLDGDPPRMKKLGRFRGEIFLPAPSTLIPLRQQRSKGPCSR